MTKRKKQFEVTHTGLYKTRAGKKAFVSYVIQDSLYGFPIFGVIEEDYKIMTWTRSGEFWTGEEDFKDIVAEWED